MEFSFWRVRAPDASSKLGYEAETKASQFKGGSLCVGTRTSDGDRGDAVTE